MAENQEKSELSVPHKIVLDKCLNQKVIDIKVEEGRFTEVVLQNGVRIQAMERDGIPRLRVEIKREEDGDTPREAR